MPTLNQRLARVRFVRWGDDAMTVYVDPLMDFGWKLRGHPVRNCHMFTDELDLSNLHGMAMEIGMKRAWFQNNSSAPHYDLTTSRREAAVKCGAAEVDHHQAGEIWKARRDAVRAKQNQFAPERHLPNGAIVESWGQHAQRLADKFDAESITLTDAQVQMLADDELDNMD